MKKHLLFRLSLAFLFVSSLVFAGKPTNTPVYTWNGSSSSNWNTAENWTPAVVPSSTDDVIIPLNTPNDPVLEACNTTVCNTMVLESSKLKDLSATRGGLTIGGGEVVIDGNLTIKTNATLTILNDGALTVNGDIKIMTNGNLVIESGGSLITNGSITGSALVKRIVPDNLSWHFLSSPVTSQVICNGTFAPTPANFGTTPVNTWDFYKWLANCPTPPLPPEHWRNLRNSDVTINTTDFGATPGFEVTKGYLVAYGSGFPTTKIFTGTPNTGDMVFSFSDVITDCSWELAGNPYPSSFDWNQVNNKANLENGYYYIWNENKVGGPGYEAYLDNTNKTPGVDGNIPSMQGFFVKVDPTKSKVFDVPNSSRVHDLDLWLKNSENISSDKLTITIGNGVNSDDAIVLFRTGASIGKDWYDAEKMFSIINTLPQVYTIINNDLKTVINSMGYTDNPVSIPIGFVAPAAGTYTLTFSGIESFGALNGLVLEDLEENISQNLFENSTYTFTSFGIEDAGRFLLHFSGPIGINETGKDPINIFSSEKNIFITSKNGLRDATVVVRNLLGQDILSQTLSNQPMNKVTVNAPAGYYLVSVTTATSSKTMRVFIH